MKKDSIVVVREGWEGEGRRGRVLSLVSLDQDWAVVVLDGDEDPECFKLAALELCSGRALQKAFAAYLGVVEFGGEILPISASNHGHVLEADEKDATKTARYLYGPHAFAVRVKVTPA